MERALMKKLVEWKDSPVRKPLVLKGARQVGKTWLMKEFGKQYFKKVAYVNFDHNPVMQHIFDQDFDIQRILMAVNIETGVVVTPGDTLIIFDEVQEAPAAISSLKYFCENGPEYPVIAAGSMLGVALHEGISYPVGKVNTLSLYPLSFYEFLMAQGEEGLARLLDARDMEMMNAFHDKYVTALKNYYYTGGMPEIVRFFSENKDYAAVRKMQEELLEMYEADFSKHMDPRELPRVRMVWHAIPAQLAKENKKFFFGQVKKGARAKDFEMAVEWLMDCGLITRVNRVTKPAVPLKAYAEENAYKLYFLDTGLLGALSGLDAKSILEGNRIFTEFKGALTEQYVCQQMIADRNMDLFYMLSESGRYEIDFLVQHEGNVVPIEVKAGQTVHAKSLRSYCEKYEPSLAIRLSMNPCERQDRLLNMPLYGVHCLL
ncbi:ATP-binding protein [Dialister sp.]|uniref:ATP-binding protein n=1 Tax=Dialister sp. TaxID=1955814 RepID=UPI003A5BCB19